MHIWACGTIRTNRKGLHPNVRMKISEETAQKKAQDSFNGAHMAHYVWWLGLPKDQFTFLLVVICLLLTGTRAQSCIGSQEMEKKSNKK